MTTTTSRRSTRLLALGGLLAAILVWPTAVAADTTGGGGADLGLDAVSVSTIEVQARTGLVTVAGQVDCSQDLQASVWIELTQVVGRLWTISGGGATEVECLAADGSANFGVSFYAWSGKFAPGPARLQGFAETGYCTEEECFFDGVAIGPMPVRLTR